MDLRLHDPQAAFVGAQSLRRTTASFGVFAAPPAGTATPKRGRSIFAWYSWIFTARSYRFSISASPNSLHLSSVAPSIRRWKS